MFRRLVRRFGSWLVLWADHWARIHVCPGTRTETHEPYGNGVTWGETITPHASTTFIQLNRGDTCPYCGERA